MKSKLLKKLRKRGARQINILSVTTEYNWRYGDGYVVGMSYSYSDEKYAGLFSMGDTKDDVTRKAIRIFIDDYLKHLQMATSNKVFVSPGVYTSEKDLTFVAQKERKIKMTANEMAKTARVSPKYWDENNGYDVPGPYVSEYHFTQEEFRKYNEQHAKEQREICASKSSLRTIYEDWIHNVRIVPEDEILRSPSPEIEYN